MLRPLQIPPLKVGLKAPLSINPCQPAGRLSIPRASDRGVERVDFIRNW
jgi:hypothetical protein